MVEKHCAFERVYGATNWTVIWTRYVTRDGGRLKQISDAVFVGLNAPRLVLTVVEGCEPPVSGALLD